MTGAGVLVGLELDGGGKLEQVEAVYFPGARSRAQRIATLEQEDFARFRLAAKTQDGSCFWWTRQRDGSPLLLAGGRVVMTFRSVVLSAPLALKEWLLVDDGGHLVRVRRAPAVFPKGKKLDAAYHLAFDGSDRRW